MTRVLLACAAGFVYGALNITMRRGIARGLVLPQCSLRIWLNLPGLRVMFFRTLAQVRVRFPVPLEPTSTIGSVAEFVPPDFDVPLSLETSEFVLEPLGPEHNEQDYDAWTSSMRHIAATPGYPDGSWPREMTRDENRADLQRHADDFRNRKGFTYTVLDPASREVIGCVYIYPVSGSDYDACALSWVRESQAHLDTPLWRAVSEWLESDWPFARVEYAPRRSDGARGAA